MTPQPLNLDEVRKALERYGGLVYVPPENVATSTPAPPGLEAFGTLAAFVRPLLERVEAFETERGTFEAILAACEARMKALEEDRELLDWLGDQTAGPAGAMWSLPSEAPDDFVSGKPPPQSIIDYIQGHQDNEDEDE